MEAFWICTREFSACHTTHRTTPHTHPHIAHSYTPHATRYILHTAHILTHCTPPHTAHTTPYSHIALCLTPTHHTYTKLAMRDELDMNCLIQVSFVGELMSIRPDVQGTLPMIFSSHLLSLSSSPSRLTNLYLLGMAPRFTPLLWTFNLLRQQAAELLVLQAVATRSHPLALDPYPQVLSASDLAETPLAGMPFAAHVSISTLLQDPKSPHEAPHNPKQFLLYTELFVASRASILHSGYTAPLVIHILVRLRPAESFSTQVSMYEACLGYAHIPATLVVRFKYLANFVCLRVGFLFQLGGGSAVKQRMDFENLDEVDRAGGGELEPCQVWSAGEVGLYAQTRRPRGDMVKCRMTVLSSRPSGSTRATTLLFPRKSLNGARPRAG